MRNILRIFKRDFKNVINNWVALVVILGLMMLPALYAWFNIKAGWDPYSNTKGIKVAIVNKDLGEKLEIDGEIGERIKNKNINVGEELVSKLKENDALGWQFVDEQQGISGVERGKYYATIIIPEDFTKKTTSILSSNIEKPELIYKVNQKSNAIAPKITDKGVSTIKTQIDSTIVETIDGVIFKVFNEAGVSIEELKPKLLKIVDGIIKLNDRMPEIENLVDKAYTGTHEAEDITKKINENMPLVEETLNDTLKLLSNTKEALKKAKEGLTEVTPIVRDGLNTLNTTLDSIQVILNDLSSVTVDKNKVISSLDNIIVKLTELKDSLNSMIKVLEPLGKLNPQVAKLTEELRIIEGKLDGISTFIVEVKNSVNNNGLVDKSKLENLKNLISEVNGIIDQIISKYDSEYVPEINKAIESLGGIIDNSIILANEAETSMPEVKDLINKLGSGVTLGKEELLKLKDDMPQIKNEVSNIANKVQGLNNDEKIEEIVKILRNDWEKTSSFLGNPVDVKRE